MLLRGHSILVNGSRVSFHAILLGFFPFLSRSSLRSAEDASSSSIVSDPFSLGRFYFPRLGPVAAHLSSLGGKLVRAYREAADAGKLISPRVAPTSRK